jgi:hypothetical protein
LEAFGEFAEKGVAQAKDINTNAAFRYANELLGVRSLSEFIELSSAHARKQFDTLTGDKGTYGARPEGGD